jgi:hypothetical protein
MKTISEKTISDLDEQAYTFESTLLLMRAIGADLGKVGEKYRTSHLYQAIQILLGRNIILLFSSYQSGLTGLYGTARTLMRLILEHAFLMRYFAYAPREATKWVKDVNWYNKQKPFRIRALTFQGKILEDYNRAYRRLSSYIHPSIEGWTELLVPKGDNMVFIRYDPYYDQALAADTLSLLLFLQKLTMKPVLLAFKSELSEGRLSDLAESQAMIDMFLPPDTVS